MKKNVIASFWKGDGAATTSLDEIQEQFLKLYKGLSGEKEDVNPIDVSVIDYGPKLSSL